MTDALRVAVSPVFRRYIEQAVQRLSYLHPELDFTAQTDAILVGGAKEETSVARQVIYQLYREKIYQESLPMRELMYRALLS